jgi:alkylhydroperoxidase/carboxymuconolactone decarboxylase family protein YurZ
MVRHRTVGVLEGWKPASVRTHGEGAHTDRVVPPSQADATIGRSPQPAGAHRQGRTPVAQDTPLLDTVVDINALSIDRSSLEGRELMLARLAALVAVEAPPASYLMNGAAAEEVGVTAEDVRGVLIAVAPIVGTPRVIAAAGNIADALGIAVGLAEAELATQS